MKKEFNLSIVLAVSAAILAGCGQRRDCVDAMGNRLPDTACRTGSGAGGYPRYIYGGSFSNGRVSGGSTSPSTTSSPRGGFGGSGFSGG
jgi:hypothetical protein